MHLLIPAQLLMACGPDDPLPSTWTYEEGGEPAEKLDIATLEQGLAQALLDVRRLDPLVGIARYEAVLSAADTSCPAFDDSYGEQRFWEDDCTTGEGTRFAGWALSHRSQNVEIGGDLCFEDAAHYGFARIESAGSTWDGWGELTDAECQDPSTGATRFQATYRGDFRWTGGGGSWLDEPRSLDLYSFAIADGANRSLTLFGGISGVVGQVPGVWFAEARFESASCPLEPEGTITLFGMDGLAYDVAFGGDCDGCGVVTVEGQLHGEVCLDASVVLDWQDRPWE